MAEKCADCCAHDSASQAKPGRSRSCGRKLALRSAGALGRPRGQLNPWALASAQPPVLSQDSHRRQESWRLTRAARGEEYFHDARDAAVPSRKYRIPEDGGGPSSGFGVVTVHLWFG